MKAIHFLLLVTLLAFAGCSGDNPTAPLSTDADQSISNFRGQLGKGDSGHDQGLMNDHHGMVPFRGTYFTVVAEAGFEPPSTVLLDIWGDGNASFLGKSTWYSLSYVDVTTGAQWGSTVEVAANGDEFHYDYSGGSAVDEETGLTNFWGDWTVTGGTGRFTGATGGGTYEGTADGTQGTGQITLVGEISRPNSNRFTMD
jgi:hypothetical protein